MSDPNSMSQVDRELQAERFKKAKRKRQNLELLAIKKPTSIDDVRARVPTPKNPLPQNSLPEWKERRLDAKFPAIPAPDGSFIVSKGLIGDKVFLEHCKKHEFDTRDPLIQETPLEYVSLHDPNLREYFQTNPIVCKRLVELGMVTCEGEVICRLDEFNKYRTYLGRIHNTDVARLKQEIEHWEQTEHANIKLVTRYLKNSLKHKLEEERKKKREKNVAELAEKNRQRKLKALEHPSNFLKEKRLIEAKLRKFKRDAMHRNAMDRVKRIRDNERRRARKLVLDWICKDAFREKLRCVIKLEKEVNRQQDLCDFVETKRIFQEKKSRFHKALLRRDKIENECKVSQRAENYVRKKQDDEERAITNKQMAQEKAERTYYLMEKYGRRWLALTRKYTGNPMHSSSWHIRNILHGLVQHVKAESGAKNLADYLKDIMKKSRGPEIKPETKLAVNSILDSLVNRSYREFIRRATTCLVDFVVDEARKKCMNSHVCEPKVDPKDLEAPVYPTRKHRHINLPKPTYPLDGPCSRYVKTGYWPCSCSEQLENIHGELCANLLKKLTRCMKRAMKCSRGGLDGLENRASEARGSPLVCGAIEACADIVLNGTCKKDKTKVDKICKNLCASILGPETCGKPCQPCKRRPKPCDAPSRKPEPSPCNDNRRTQTPTPKSKTSGAGKDKKDGAVGTGPRKTTDRGVTPYNKPTQDRGQTSEHQTTDSETEGVPIAPLADKGTEGPKQTGKGTDAKPPQGVDQEVGGRPSGVDKGTDVKKAVSKASQKPKPRGLDATTGKEPGRDTGTDGQSPAPDVGTEVAKPDVSETGTDTKPGTDEATEVPPPALVDSGTGKDKEDENTQVVPPPATDEGVGEPTTDEDKIVGPEPEEDTGTDTSVPATADKESGKPPPEDKETGKPSPATSESGTTGPTSEETGTEKVVEPGEEKETTPESVTDAGVGDENVPKEDKATEGKPSKDAASDPSPTPTEEKPTETTPTPVEDTSTELPPTDDKVTGPDERKDKGSNAESEPTDDKVTGPEPPRDESTNVPKQPITDDGSSPESPNDKVTVTETQPSTEESTQPTPVQEKSTDPETTRKPSSDKDTGPEPGTEKPVEAKPSKEEKGTSRDPGDEKTTGPESAPVSDKADETDNGSDEVSEVKPEPGQEEETQPPPGEDKPTEPVVEPSKDSETGTDKGETEGTETVKPPTEDKTGGSPPPDQVGQQTDKPLTEEKESEKPVEPTEEVQTGPDKPDDKGVEKPPEATGTDGTEPDIGEDKETEAGIKKETETEGTDKPQKDGETAPEPVKTDDVGVVGPGTTDEEVSKPPDETVEAGVETQKDTVEAATDAPTKTEGDKDTEKETEKAEIDTPKKIEKAGSGPEPPCPCEISAVCKPDSEWDEALVSEDELDVNIDQLLKNVTDKMIQECIDAGGIDRDKQEQTESDVGCSMSTEIDKLIHGELFSLQNSCLQDQCAGLSDDEKKKCRDETMKKLREECLKMASADKAKCLNEVGKFFGSDVGDTCGSDISRTASCFVDSIINDQRQKLSDEIAIVGSGDDDAISAALTSDNISRIASAIVKHSICMVKCGPENLQTVGNVVPSPAVQCTVREKLNHIRSILDEVKSDLAEVGIHPTFSKTNQEVSETRLKKSKSAEKQDPDKSEGDGEGG